MAISFNNAVAAYQKIARQDALPGLSGAKPNGDGGFADALRQATEGVIDTLYEGERQTLQAALGTADLTDVVTAVNKAELTLRTVVTLRDRVIQAYQEILRMPI
ncbi:MAG: flagellar hook-basal body complex protein FliE [Alphaproteobacteria bacterium]|nr:MAG: flagellar hook-basal body complex protein FliE [Alphaproteobacteria bacterium]